MSLGCISDVSVPEGLKFRVFSLECLFGLLRHGLQMVSWRFVRCDPHSCQRDVQSHIQEFHIPASLLNSAVILFFSLHSSERPESALRPAGTVSRTLLATVRYVAVARVRFFQDSGTSVSDLCAFASRTVVRSMVAVANRKRLLSRTFR